MKARFVSVLAAAAWLSLCTGGVTLADDPTQLPFGSQVPVSLPAGGATSFTLSPSPGGVLLVNLSAGDVSASLQNDDQTNTVQNSLTGGGTMSVALSGVPSGQAYTLQLSSQSGAQLTLLLNPSSDDAGTLNVSTGFSSSSSSSSSSASSSTTSSFVNVSSNQTVTSNGAVVAASGTRIDINNGQVTITSQ